METGCLSMAPELKWDSFGSQNKISLANIQVWNVAQQKCLLVMVLFATDTTDCCLSRCQIQKDVK